MNNFLKQLRKQIKDLIEFKKIQYKLWKEKKALGRAIILANAMSEANNGVQFHIFKVGNIYHVKRRLEFKQSTDISQKEKDRMNIITLREGSIYSTPLIGNHERRLRDNELKKAKISLPHACLIFQHIQLEKKYENYILGKWKEKPFVYTIDANHFNHKDNMIYFIRIGIVRRAK